MSRLSNLRKIILGASVALGSLGIGGLGVALVSGGNASGATSSSSTGTNNTLKPAQRMGRFLFRHTVDATVTVKTKNGYQTFDLARGTVQSISSTSITVDSPDGTSLSATIDSQTKFFNTTEGQLSTGDKVGVVASQGVARAIRTPKTPSSGTGS